MRDLSTLFSVGDVWTFAPSTAPLVSAPVPDAAVASQLPMFDPLPEMLLAFIRQSPLGVSKTELTRSAPGYSAAERTAALEQIVSSGAVVIETIRPLGHPRKVYREPLQTRVLSSIRRSGNHGRSRCELHEEATVSGQPMSAEQWAVFADRLIADGLICAEHGGEPYSPGTVYRLAGVPPTGIEADAAPLSEKQPMSPDGSPAAKEMVAEPLRDFERSVLRVIREAGQITADKVWRKFKLPPSKRKETLFDLHRLGYIRMMEDWSTGNLRFFFAATSKVEPPADYDHLDGVACFGP